MEGQEMEAWESLESISWNEISSIVWSRLERFSYSADDALLSFLDICERQPYKMQSVRTLNLAADQTFGDEPPFAKLGHRGLSALVRIVKAGYFSQLQTLDLSGHDDLGRELVEALGNLFQSGYWNQLQELRLRASKITTSQVNFLAKYAASGYLSKLVSLNLSCNFLYDKDCSALAESFAAGQLSKLVSLDLSQNKIGNGGAMALANAFASGQCSKMVSLGLSDNLFKGLGAKALANAFTSGQCSKMVSLDLSSNKIGSEGAMALADSLLSGGLPNLQALKLKSCAIPDVGVEALAISFASGRCTKLNSLDLSLNDLGKAGAGALCKAFASGFLSDLRVLSLAKSNLHDGGVVALARSAKAGLLSKLESFDLTNNYIGVTGANSLGKAIASGHLSNMRSLALSGNKLQDGGVANLVDMFGGGHLSKIESLDLSDTGVKWGAPSNLAQLLESGGAKNLRYLNLSSNRIGNTGVEALANSFHNVNLSKLERLYLSYNDIGSRGAEALAFSFNSSQLSELKELNLSGNRMVDDGVQPTESICQPEHPEESVSHDHDFEQRGATSLMSSFLSPCWKKLKTLDLSWTGVDDVGVEALAKAIARGHMSALQQLGLSGICVGQNSNAMLSLVQAYGHGEWQGCELSSDLNWMEFSLRRIMVLSRLSGELITNRTLRIPVDLGEWSATCFRILASTIGGQLEVLHTSVFGTGIALAEQFPAGHWKRLRALNIRRDASRMSNESWKALMNAFQSPKLSRLEFIRLCDLKSNEHELIIDEMGRAFEAGRLQNLKALQLFDDASDVNDISENAKQTLVNCYQKNPYLVVRICAERLESGPGVMGDIGVLRRGNEERVTRLKELGEEPDVLGKHGKVFLCGNEGVGKTTLRISLSEQVGKSKRWELQCLHGCIMGRSRRKSALPPTRGIEVSNIEGSGSSTTQPLVLALWDLAGQHEYQVLHSAFLPDIALAGGQATFFVLVCSTDKPQEVSFKSVQYWLRFLSSNSLENVQERGRRRRVFVVLNCFYGGLSDHNEEDWKFFLGQCQSRFGRFLNLDGDPFIFDATHADQVHQLKETLLTEADSLLKNRKMPRICFTIQENCKKWIERRRRQAGYYPVLAWDEFSSQIGTPWFSNAKLIAAAAQYLHEAGHLILFKMEAEALTSTIYLGPEKSLLIVDPTWFCQNVIGNLLLPERLVTEADKFQKMWRDLDLEKNPLEISTFEKWQFLVPKEKLQEVVMLMSRVGLCYQLESPSESVFIPALIQSNDAPGWYPNWSNSSNQQAWVMGFSLLIKNRHATLLPIAVLRYLQVDLAQRQCFGAPDCSYVARKYCIAFTYADMKVLIEYPFDSATNTSTEDRIDVLVKPIDSDSVPSAKSRLDQTNLAQVIVDKILSVTNTRGCCVGVKLERRIIKPWKVHRGWVGLEDRDIQFTVEEVMRRVAERGFGMMNWEEPRVRAEDLLSEKDLGSYKESVHDNYLRTEGAVRMFGLSDFSESEATPEAPQDIDNFIIWRAIKELKKVLDDLSSDVKEVKDDVKQIKEGIQKIVAAQENINVHLLNLERFSLEREEVKRTVPRFIFLKEAGNGSKWWIKLRENVYKRMTLHFLCEAHWESHRLHEVEAEDQKGVHVKHPEQWVKRILPALDWTLRLTFVAAKIAGNVVLPGLGLALSDLPENTVSRAIQMANGIPDLWKYISDTFEVGSVQHPVGHLDHSVADSLHAESSSGKDVRYLNRSFELRGEARAAVREIYNNLDDKQKREQVGLTPVWLDNDHHIVWVCNGCLKKYGEKAHQLRIQS